MKLGGSIDDYLDSEGHIVCPEGTTLTSYLQDNIAELGDSVAFRFLDYRGDPDGRPVELSWNRLGVRMRAVGARLQQVTSPRDRVAILAPQGVDYVIGLFAAIAAGNIAVPLFAPELPGHAERLRAVIGDSEPSVVLTTTEGAQAVHESLETVPRVRRPRVIAVDAMPDNVGELFQPYEAATDDIAYLQYTSGSTRTPAGVEITHRAVCTNVAQMILSVGLDRNIRSVSWLPLFHDMGLLMVMFPALCGGQLTLMSPMAFVRRPYRWIRELAAESKYGRTFAAAPNFAFDLAAQRGLPPKGEDLDLSNVGGLINGSEPVSIASIKNFTDAFRPYGLPPTAIKPSYGMAEATLFVSTIDPDAQPKAVYLDREELGGGRAVEVAPDAENAVSQVSCGRVARDQWAVIVDPNTGSEVPDGHVGEIWLHGVNIGRGYWGRTDQTEMVFQNKLQSRLEVDSHAEGAPAGGYWLRTGDLGMYLDNELYIVGRIKDMIIVDGRNHYPQDIEATAAGVSPAVRAGFVVAFGIPSENGERLVIVAERAPGKGKADPQPVVDGIRAAVSRQHALPVADVKLVAAGTIPRTTSGKLARRACRAEYLAGKLGPVAG
ncbi:AMP-binding protein [Mycolicibacterium pulveris]|uniref:Nitrate ABC transporter substrate-binding protein n=1 Tax=Mycolicibacterium pulveris TaxID=36813 RepID=A0A7I7URK9_MYCPV|nr:fatty acyl-AMP ligase [Mycolicibacterium pulveris]MCV6983314.1 AMP-binding protein [Mycolicibacterium pulveris]BBY83189.1 nitrate ABC transporter substrate-binding protein [Mycolicibacterium pulveris]